MSIELGLLIAFLGFVMSVIVNYLNQKRITKQDSEKQGYSWGKLDEKLANIEKSLNKIEVKLDNYDIEIDKKIEIALQHHIKEYHK